MATDPQLPAGSAAQVVLSYASFDPNSAAVVAAGYVTPVIEDGGTCTLSLTKAGATVTATSTGTADASTTACGNLRVSRSRLSAGTWRAVLRYSSPAASGISQNISVQVPQ
jgi:hypothetical protein